MLNKILIIIVGTFLGVFLGYTIGYGLGANYAADNLPWDFVYKEGQGYIAGGIIGKEIGIRVGTLCGFLISLISVFLTGSKKSM